MRHTTLGKRFHTAAAPYRASSPLGTLLRIADHLGRCTCQYRASCPPDTLLLQSDSVTLEAPIVALGLLEHLPERALPLARLLVLLLDPQSYLHHAPRDIPIAPQGLHSLVVVAGAGSLVEERSPCVLVLANQLDLLQGVLRLPLLHLLANLADRRLCRHWHREHSKR